MNIIMLGAPGAEPLYFVSILVFPLFQPAT